MEYRFIYELVWYHVIYLIIFSVEYIYIVYREDSMIPWHEEDLVWKTACLENSMVSCIAQNIVCAEFLSASCDS